MSGLDLGEFIKFLPAVRNGQLLLWRPGFYLPLLAVSLAFSANAFRAGLDYRRPMRVFLLVVAVVAALNMLPPAWTPALLLTSEFRLQTVAIAIALLATALSPFLGLLPRRIGGALLMALASAAFWFPLYSFLLVLPDISRVYNQRQTAAWGPYALALGLLLLLIFGLTLFRSRPSREPPGLHAGAAQTSEL